MSRENAFKISEITPLNVDLWKTDTTNLLSIRLVLISRNAKEIFPSNTDSNLMLQCCLCDLTRLFFTEIFSFLIKKVIY